MSSDEKLNADLIRQAQEMRDRGVSFRGIAKKISKQAGEKISHVAIYKKIGNPKEGSTYYEAKKEGISQSVISKRRIKEKERKKNSYSATPAIAIAAILAGAIYFSSSSESRDRQRQPSSPVPAPGPSPMPAASASSSASPSNSNGSNGGGNNNGFVVGAAPRTAPAAFAPAKPKIVWPVPNGSLSKNGFSNGGFKK